MATITETLNLTLMECSGCGIAYAVPEPWRQQRVRDHKTFTCPNGCVRHYAAEREAEILKRELLAQQASINEANHLRIVAERALAKQIAERKRVEARVHRGVCPCCNRSFENLARHMKSKHAHEIEGVEQKRIAAPVQ